MSFILDALRKSENERRQTQMPSIVRMPLAPPKSRMPAWAGTLIAVLVVAVIFLGTAWWRSLSDSPATVRSVTVQPAPGELSRPETPAAQRPPAALRDSVPTTSALRTLTAPPVAATSPQGGPAQVSIPVTSDVAPSSRTTSDAPLDMLPTIEELQADGITLPDLRIELHGYGPASNQRFAFINGQRYTEGQTLREGPRLIAITPDGAVLEYRDSEFRLRAQ